MCKNFIVKRLYTHRYPINPARFQLLEKIPCNVQRMQLDRKFQRLSTNQGELSAPKRIQHGRKIAERRRAAAEVYCLEIRGACPQRSDGGSYPLRVFAAFGLRPSGAGVERAVAASSTAERKMHVEIGRAFRTGLVKLDAHLQHPRRSDALSRRRMQTSTPAEQT